MALIQLIKKKKETGWAKITENPLENNRSVPALWLEKPGYLIHNVTATTRSVSNSLIVQKKRRSVQLSAYPVAQLAAQVIMQAVMVCKTVYNGLAMVGNGIIFWCIKTFTCVVVNLLY